jgi:DNA repair exonuclease SbcCD nuclease subunit
MTLQTTTSKLCEAVRKGSGITKSGDINIASVSDIHLGHPRTETLAIVDNLYKAFPDNEETAKLDLILLAGDVFDRLLTLPQEEVDAIQEWIAWLLHLCVKYNIILRVLEGTPSHDWKQSRQFANINAGLKQPANLKYVETLSIETIEELGGLTVLYVPDEWNHDANVTWLQVCDLLKEHGLEKVDVACMHGAFDYQLPIESIKNHSAERYQSIVNHFIVIGHVHIRSKKGIIHAQGSFDRLSHGEESAKGHYRLTISPKGNHSHFVENKDAKLYMTVDCREMTVEELFKYMRSIEDLRHGTALRFLIQRESELFRDVREIRRAFPQFKITTQADELKVPEAQTLRQTGESIERPISITPTNIDHLVKDRAPRVLPNADAHQMQHMMQMLEKYRYPGAA